MTLGPASRVGIIPVSTLQTGAAFSPLPVCSDRVLPPPPLRLTPCLEPPPDDTARARTSLQVRGPGPACPPGQMKQGLLVPTHGLAGSSSPLVGIWPWALTGGGAGAEEEPVVGRLGTQATVAVMGPGGGGTVPRGHRCCQPAAHFFHSAGRSQMGVPPALCPPTAC